MRNLEGETFGKLKVIEFVGKNNIGQDMYGCICECGNITKANCYKLTSGHTKSCGCIKSIAAKNATPPIDLTGRKFGRLNILSKFMVKKTYSSGTTKNISHYYAWCDCQADLPFEEREIKTYSQSMLLNGKAKSCGCLRRELASQNKAKDITNQKFGYLTAIEPISERDKAGHILWKCLCDCGNITYVQVHSLITGNTKTCGRCGINGSLGEDKIRKILKENNIIFNEQKTYDDLYVTNPHHKLKYDFYINNSYIIEYDGEQHYKSVSSWGGEDGYNQRQLYDYIKNRYCFDNNIQIIRIPYWHYDDICLNDLLLESSDYLLTDIETNDEFEEFYQNLFDKIRKGI